MIQKVCKVCEEPFQVPGHSTRRVYCTPCRNERLTQPAQRRGVFVGGYVPAELKRALQQQAAREHRTVSQELARLIEEGVRP
jgi:hypothetical protein